MRSPRPARHRRRTCGPAGSARSAQRGRRRGRGRARGCCFAAAGRRSRAMTEASSRKEGFKKCRSATFSIDGYSFTIGENFPPPVRLEAWASPLSGGGGEGAFSTRDLGGVARGQAGSRGTRQEPGERRQGRGSPACGGVAATGAPRGAPPSALTPHPGEAASLKGSVSLP